MRANGPAHRRRDRARRAPRRKDNWGWNWSAVKQALEYLFWSGEVTAAARNGAFARLYDLPERVLPAGGAGRADPGRRRTRSGRWSSVAARALGVAAESELRDYFRLPVAGARAAIAELVEAGRPAARSGARAGSQPAYLHAEAQAAALGAARRPLISPFDPLIWERARTERLFDFRYRIEIYVPAPQRVHGYYVLPFLLGDRLVGPGRPQGRPQGRRAAGPGRLVEPAVRPGRDGAAALAAELRRLAGWLGLGEVAAPGGAATWPARSRRRWPAGGRVEYRDERGRPPAAAAGRWTSRPAGPRSPPISRDRFAPLRRAATGSPRSCTGSAPARRAGPRRSALVCIAGALGYTLWQQPDRRRRRRGADLPAQAAPPGSTARAAAAPARRGTCCTATCPRPPATTCCSCSRCRS